MFKSFSAQSTASCIILTTWFSVVQREKVMGKKVMVGAICCSQLAALHCLFCHHQQAELALQEAIRIAQESKDHVCLQHCLSWLYVLGQKRAHSYVLLEHSVKNAVHFGLFIAFIMFRMYLVSFYSGGLLTRSCVGFFSIQKMIIFLLIFILFIFFYVGGLSWWALLSINTWIPEMKRTWTS